MQMRSVLFGSLIAAVGLTGQGCATRVRVQRIQPAEVEVHKGDRLAFVPFNGNDGAALQGVLERSISTGNFFQIVDRKHLDAVLAEQKRVMSGVTQDDGRVRVGELAAAGAILNGEAFVRFNDNRTSERRNCSRTDPKTQKVVSFPCTLYVHEGSVEYVAKLTLTDTTTGTVLAMRPYRKVKSDRNERYDAAPEPVTPGPLVDAARNEVADEFFRVISPHAVYEEVLLVKDGKLPQLETGNKFAQQGNWGQAAQFYGQAAQLVAGGAIKAADEVLAKAYYSLGLALVMQGDFAHGLENLNRAAGLDPDDDYISFTSRASRWAAEHDRLARQKATEGASEATGATEP